MFKWLIDWLFPKECIICGKSGKWVCDDCLENLEFNPINFCPFCKRRSFLGLTCKKCKKEKNKKLDGIFSYCSYRNPIIRKIIYNYKYKYLVDLKFILTNMIINTLNNIKKAQAIGVLPKIITKKTLFFSVPLYKKRLRQRGFNQSELLLDELVNQNIISADNIKFKDFFQRIKYTIPQVKLKAKERKKNLNKAFAYSGESLENKNIILIDDVATTCNTLEECAKVLKQSGARKVYGVVVAKG